MSHNKKSFGGVLQPLVDLLSRLPRLDGKLNGQEIVLERDGIQAIVALDVDEAIHLLITPAPNNDLRLAKLDLKGLKVVTKEWAIAGRPIRLYLDISCAIGIMPAFKRPFLRFTEDVLLEISESEISPADAVYRTGTRWKKFWSADAPTEVTTEWLNGLFGELIFLHHLIERYGTDAVFCWAGTSGADHDFQKGKDIAIEVKTSMKMPLKIHCNIRQLDTDIFKKLFIVCYHLSYSDKGITLPEIVRMIEKSLELEVNLLDIFYEKLAASKYSCELEVVYLEKSFTYSQELIYRVNDSFPKITGASFNNPPDHRISDIRYTLQLTSLEELSFDEVKDEISEIAKQ
ncbi:MAG: hypothetical protein JWO00_464 [Candidatus Parcubacteria bacterium]|nr:hypothetical protein [Candidatus Parcubacteria bacterium]